MHAAVRTLPAVLFLVTTSATAAVPGEVIAAHNLSTGRYAVMSATDGSSFVEGTCRGDLTHARQPALLPDVRRRYDSFARWLPEQRTGRFRRGLRADPRDQRCGEHALLQPAALDSGRLEDRCVCRAIRPG